MRHVIFAFLFIAIVLVSSSCQDTKNHTVVHIDLNESHSEPSIKIEQIILLETSDEALIGEIHKIRHYKGNYYLMDLLISKNLFLFDSLGGFISSLQRGKGPGEVEHFNEFFIDEVKDLVYVYDYPQNIHVYDLRLNYLYSEIHKDLRIRSAELLNSDILIINWPRMPSAGNSCNFGLYSLYDLSKKRYLNSFMELNENLISVVNSSPISVFNDRILVSKTFDNSLYVVNIEESVELIKPQKTFYFDFGRLAITEQDIIAGVSTTYAKSRMGEKIVPFYSLSENENYISFNFSLFGQDNFMIYSKETGKYYYSADLFNADLLPISRLNNALSPSRFLAFAQPENIIQFANANNSYELPGGVSILDNPCLIIFSLVEN